MVFPGIFSKQSKSLYDGHNDILEDNKLICIKVYNCIKVYSIRASLVAQR